MTIFSPCFKVLLHTSVCFCVCNSNLTPVNRSDAWICWTGCSSARTESCRDVSRVPECFSIQNINTLEHHVPPWCNCSSRCQVDTESCVCLHPDVLKKKNHMKMMWQVLKRSTLAPSTKAQKHQAPFRAARLCNGGEAVGASKSLRASSCRQ